MLKASSCFIAIAGLNAQPTFVLTLKPIRDNIFPDYFYASLLAFTFDNYLFLLMPLAKAISSSRVASAIL